MFIKHIQGAEHDGIQYDHGFVLNRAARRIPLLAWPELTFYAYQELGKKHGYSVATLQKACQKATEWVDKMIAHEDAQRAKKS